MERTVPESTLELDTPTDLPLLERIIKTATLISFTDGADKLNHPLIILPDVATAIRVLAHADEYDEFTYTHDCRDQWIAQFNKPVSEEACIRLCSKIYKSTNFGKMQHWVSVFTKDPNRLLSEQPEMARIQSELELCFEAFPALTGTVWFSDTMQIYIQSV
jgi:hypothetical protein